MSSASSPAVPHQCHYPQPDPFGFLSPANKVVLEKLVELRQKSPPATNEKLIEELRTTKQLEAVDGVPYPN